MAQALPKVVRRVHRWLAVVVGVQLLAWTAGGVYFSWTKLAAIRGEHLVRQPIPVPVSTIDWQNLALALQPLAEASLERLESFYLAGEPVVRVQLKTQAGRRVFLFAANGTMLSPLDRTQAEALAKQAFLPQAEIASVRYLKEVPAGHEYRNRPLPAYAVTFNYPGRPTVYVAANSGEVAAIRHDDWRRFDFLWMLHTLDFRGRDDINNPWLRLASAVALVTLLSGYLLFVATGVRRKASRTRPLPPKPESVSSLHSEAHPTQRQ